MGLYDTFDYTGGFVACNIFSILSMVGCLKALTNAPGKAGSSGLARAQIQQHVYGYGPMSGVKRGDTFDAYMQFFVIPLKLMCWVPIGLCQCYTVMGDFFASLAILAVMVNFIVTATTDKKVKSAPNAAIVLWVLGIMPLLNTVFRIAYFTLPHVAVDSVDAFVTVFAIWFTICTIHPGIVCNRGYSMKADVTFSYMNDLGVAHLWHCEGKDPASGEKYGEKPPSSPMANASELELSEAPKGDPKWEGDALHPEGFDPLTMGPVGLLEDMREATGKPLSTAQEIQDHIEEFIDNSGYGFAVWMAYLVVFFGVQCAIPPIIDAAYS